MHIPLKTFVFIFLNNQLVSFLQLRSSYLWLCYLVNQLASVLMAGYIVFRYFHHVIIMSTPSPFNYFNNLDGVSYHFISLENPFMGSYPMQISWMHFHVINLHDNENKLIN